MGDPEKPDDGQDLDAELADVQERLDIVKKKVEAARAARPPVPPEKAPASRSDFVRVTVEQIEAKLGEVREARRVRQSTPFPERKPTKPKE
jgi:hypothetical protein